MALENQEEKRSDMTLRIPLKLKEQLQSIAQTNKRSLTREIEVALRKYVDEHEQVDTNATIKVS